jgi:hypothetical protein
MRYALEGVVVPTEKTLKKIEKKGAKELRKRGQL